MYFQTAYPRLDSSSQRLGSLRRGLGLIRENLQYVACYHVMSNMLNLFSDHFLASPASLLTCNSNAAYFFPPARYLNSREDPDLLTIKQQTSPTRYSLSLPPPLTPQNPKL